MKRWLVFGVVGLLSVSVSALSATASDEVQYDSIELVQGLFYESGGVDLGIDPDRDRVVYRCRGVRAHQGVVALARTGISRIDCCRDRSVEFLDNHGGGIDSVSLFSKSDV